MNRSRVWAAWQPVIARAARHGPLSVMRRGGSTCTVIVVLLALGGRPVSAQDFAPVVPPALTPGAVPLLDLGLPPSSATAELASGVSRPFGLTELDAGWLVVGGGWRAVRSAVGAGRAGDPSLGWHALGAGVGWAHADAGIALRAVARRDRALLATAANDLPSSPTGRSLDPGDSAPSATGVEVGAGGWVEFAGNGYAWVAHPQLATRGAAPPLRRALEAGIAWRSGPTCAWLVREAAPRTRASETHRAGLALGVPGAWVWSEMREGPVRAAIGVVARAGPIAVAAVADLHPVLPPTARLSLSVGGAAW